VGDERRSGTQGFAQAVDAQHIVLVDPLVVGGVFELDRQDAEIRQVLPVNPGERFGDDDTQTQIPGSDRGVLA
jgi:hypothetical protein